MNAKICLLLSLTLLFPYPAGYSRTLVSGGSEASADTLEPGQESLVDRKAKVFAVTGEAEILKGGAPEWVPLQVNAVIEEGDRVRTGENASAEIVYDDYFLNYVRLEENSDMEFRSIEETDIYLSVGKLFNNLGGLVENSEYEVTTPTSVAAVRGTSFLREYDPEELSDDTSVVEGVVNVVPILDGKPDFSQGQNIKKDQALRFDRDMIRNRAFHQAKPRALEQKQKNRIAANRKKAQERLREFAGGRDPFNKARKQFQNVKKDPGQMRKIKNKMSGRPGKPGIHNNQKAKGPVQRRAVQGQSPNQPQRKPMMQGSPQGGPGKNPGQGKGPGPKAPRAPNRSKG